MSKPLQVRMTIYVTVDREKWAEQNGTEATSAAVRADVARYVSSSAHALPAITDAEPDSE